MSSTLCGLFLCYIACAHVACLGVFMADVKNGELSSAERAIVHGALDAKEKQLLRARGLHPSSSALYNAYAKDAAEVAALKAKFN